MPADAQLPFRDRDAAGRRLAAALTSSSMPQGGGGWVLALPRGGVPVACAVAHALGWPLDVLAVRKLGVPAQPEYAMGAIASGGWQVLNEEVLREQSIGAAALEAVLRQETAELARREAVYRGGRPPPDLRGRTVIVVDDGLATGATLRVAVQAVRAQSPSRVVVAVPVAAADALEPLRRHADEVVGCITPQPFGAVGRWYRDFTPVSDDEVRRRLSDGPSGAQRS